jgi:hypothetical protein
VYELLVTHFKYKLIEYKNVNYIYHYIPSNNSIRISHNIYLKYAENFGYCNLEYFKNIVVEYLKDIHKIIINDISSVSYSGFDF